MGRLTGARLSPLVAVLPLLFGTVQPNALRLQRLGDGSNCTRRLVADGCLQSLSKRACGDCAEKHGADLLQANCTKDLVTDWCEHKLPVPPRPPPPDPAARARRPRRRWPARWRARRPGGRRRPRRARGARRSRRRRLRPRLAQRSQQRRSQPQPLSRRPLLHQLPHPLATRCRGPTRRWRPAPRRA